MKTRFKRLSALLLAGILTVSSIPGTTAFAETTSPAGIQTVDENDIVILYTNDVHNAYTNNAKSSSQGYASLAWLKNQIKETTNHVALVDNGDAIQGDLIGTLSKGSYIVDIMNKVGYDVAIPGNHEFDFGMDNFLEIASKKANYKYVSCNFLDLKTNKSVLDPYTMKSYTVDGNQIDVAFVGISTPETFTKSTPTYFQDENGNYIYDFCQGNNGDTLASQVQKTVDAAKEAGAEYVVALSHLGTDDSSSPYTSKEIIAKTNGIDVLLDGHSHSKIEGDKVANKDGKEILLSSTGDKTTSFGELVIDNSESTLSTSLVSGITNEDPDTKEYVDSITAKFEDLQNEKVAKTEVDLVINDPEGSKSRLIRNQETNLGDLCADAYFALFKDYGVDCAFVNGGGIRATVNKGDITSGMIYSVHPFGNAACLVEATGQQILDALEMSSRGTPDKEIGGFLQVSGISYDIDATVPSSVVLDDMSNFVKVEGARRVKNVKIQGKDIDPAKKYKVASHNYMLKSCGDGMTMFKGATILQDEMALDNELLRKYIVEDLGGTITADSIYANPYGEGRIRVINSKSVENGCITILQGEKSLVVDKHTLQKVAQVESTCCEAGVKEHYECIYCNAKYMDAEGKIAAKDEDIVIPTKAHKLTKVAEVPATCTKAGVRAHYECSECKGKFADSKGTSQVSDKTLEIKAKGHSWDSGKVVKKPTLTKTGLMKYTCKRCKATKTVTLAKLKKQTLKLTPASKVYKAKDLKRKNKTCTLKITGNKTSLSFKITGKKATKYISVSKKGLITIKKGIPKGKYYITVTAKETLKYAKATKTFKLTIK